VRAQQLGLHPRPLAKRQLASLLRPYHRWLRHGGVPKQHALQPPRHGTRTCSSVLGQLASQRPRTRLLRGLVAKAPSFRRLVACGPAGVTPGGPSRPATERYSLGQRAVARRLALFSSRVTRKASEASTPAPRRSPKVVLVERSPRPRRRPADRSRRGLRPGPPRAWSASAASLGPRPPQPDPHPNRNRAASLARREGGLAAVDSGCGLRMPISKTRHHEGAPVPTTGLTTRHAVGCVDSVGSQRGRNKWQPGRSPLRAREV